MQKNESNKNQSDIAARGAVVGRHRAPSKRTGRSPYIAAALAAVVGLSVVGVSVATAGNGAGDPATIIAVADDEQARADAARRADRSERDAAPSSPAGTDAAEADVEADVDVTEPASPSPAETTTAPPEATTAPPATTKPATTAPPATTKPAAPAKSTAAPPATTKPAAPAKSTAAWVHPMPGARTTSCFGMRGGVLHAGIDLAQPANTPIHAAAGGTVTVSGWAYTGYGISVVIDHGNGYLTHYAHQNRTAVEVGQKVSAGDVIGYEGSTGDSTGPHLHFEVHNGLWNQIDPAPWMRERGVDLGC